MTSALDPVGLLGQVYAATAGRLGAMLIDPASDLSLLSLLSAFLIAAGFLTVRRGQRRRPGLRALWRALVPRGWLVNRSVRADALLVVLNSVVTAAVFGWAMLSGAFVARQTGAGLDALFGQADPLVIPRAAMAAVLTVVFYLAAELGYYVDHYLKHHVPVLWHFHRVHHTAEVLTPLTNGRMHPVDSIVFANIVALTTGIAGAMTGRLVEAPGGAVIIGHNAIVLAGVYLLVHLQHSQVWIAFSGPLGRWVLSPAHHQLHHSTDPKHFNSNLGATLAVFDRLAGTLRVPAQERERLTFGAGPHAVDPHGITGLLVTPFVDAAAEVRGSSGPEPAAELVTR